MPEQDSLAAPADSFHAFPAPGRPASGAGPGRGLRATHEGADTRLSWPPTEARLVGSRFATAVNQSQVGQTVAGQAIRPDRTIRPGQTDPGGDLNSPLLPAAEETRNVQSDLDWL